MFDTRVGTNRQRPAIGLASSSPGNKVGDSQVVHGSAAREEVVGHRVLVLYPQAQGVELLGAAFLCIPHVLLGALRLLEIGVECLVPVDIGRGEALQSGRRAPNLFSAGIETRYRLLLSAGGGRD